MHSALLARPQPLVRSLQLVEVWPYLEERLVPVRCLSQLWRSSVLRLLHVDLSTAWCYLPAAKLYRSATEEEGCLRLLLKHQRVGSRTGGKCRLSLLVRQSSAQCVFTLYSLILTFVTVTYQQIAIGVRLIWTLNTQKLFTHMPFIYTLFIKKTPTHIFFCIYQNNVQIYTVCMRDIYKWHCVTNTEFDVNYC